ncbi:MAG: adenylate kinase [Parcubacteria group bacterium Greene0714_7]|nr:MAG: adenylate kinase [Parcubacteria group bacterium Greene0714_7]
MVQNLGKRIVIVGVSASGKSVFARKLAQKINLPLIFVDAIMWQTGWSYIGDVETAKKLDEVSSASEWIIEGYIVKEARSFVFERADSIIYLDYHPLIASLRYIQRWWMHRKNSRPELAGSPEKFSWKFLKLVWTKGEAVSLNRFLAQLKDKNKIIKLHSPKEAKHFLSHARITEV